MRSVKQLLMIMVVVVLVSACALNAPPGAASITDQQARRIAEGTLLAMNEGDYEKFVENFSAQLRQAMDEDSFTSLRQMVQETSGDFISLSGPKLVKTASPQVVGYVFDCKFEKEDVILTQNYLVDEDEVVGLFLNSPNLRKLNQ